MGIADDIKPKKYRRHFSQSEKIILAEQKIEKEREEVVEDLFENQGNSDFFDGTPIATNKNRESKKQPQSKDTHKPEVKDKKSYNLLVLILAVMIFVLSGLLIWQNFSKIKAYFSGSVDVGTDQKLSDILDSTENQNQNYSSESDSPVEQSQTQPITPTIDKSTIKISILNGSGVKSSAKIAANVLTTAGFTISYTGNARTFNYQKTYIYYKSDGVDKANLVKTNLTGYDSETSLSPTIVGSNFDIVIVIGKT